MLATMKISVNIDDDVFRAVRSLATSRGQPLGQVMSELMRKALRPQTQTGRVGFTSVRPSDDAAATRDAEADHH